MLSYSYSGSDMEKLMKDSLVSIDKSLKELVLVIKNLDKVELKSQRTIERKRQNFNKFKKFKESLTKMTDKQLIDLEFDPLTRRSRSRLDAIRLEYDKRGLFMEKFDLDDDLTSEW